MMPSMLSFDAYLVWLIAGFVLVILELVTGTFYLLVLGIAAFAGAAAAFFGGAFWVQALSAAIVAVSGVLWAYKRHLSDAVPAMKSLDAGQPVRFESWVNCPAGHARVRYRDVSWDATLEGDAVAGDVFYVLSIDGNTLKVARTRQG